MGWHVLCLLACVLLCSEASESDPVVKTSQGTLKGTYQESASGRLYAAFQGIPYAKPPVGKLRFKEAVPAKSWRGVWIADGPRRECIQQTLHFQIVGEEDCLYINVYTPSLDASTPPMDVIVNIHGGAFMQGSGDRLGPKYILDRDVIYVNFNYRLGILGFFSTGDTVVPGNNGLKDQVLALQWVQKNIAAFGGDPKRVTITGTSAGGVSVHMHYLSPVSTGLFHRGISPSGTVLNSWSQVEDLIKKGEMVATLLGCPTHPTKDLIDCLRNRPAIAIVSLVKHFSVWYGIPCVPWGPTVEVPHPKAFLSEQPIDIIMSGRVQPVPWLTGVTTHEGLYPMSGFLGCPDRMAELAARWDELAPLIMDWNSTVPPNQHKAVAQSIKKFYLGDKPISSEASAELIQMVGDRLFVVDVERAARVHANHISAPVYFYQFAYRGKNSLSKFISGKDTNWGTSHGDETAYVYDAFYMKSDETEEDRAMSRYMVDMWVNFVQTGNPSTTKVTWQPLQPNQKEMQYLWIGDATNIEMRSTVDFGHRDFWDSLPIQESQIIMKQAVHLEDEL